jgi:prepilin-type N-terminal cleavage/methylation domain-containing protein
MPTSGCCRHDRAQRPGQALRGFTLLEMLVVLAVLSLVVGLAAPRLYRTYQAVVERGEREGIVAQLAALSLRANALGVAFTLAADSIARILPDGRPMIALPAGWQLSTDRPIRFNFVGMCDGGTVRLRSPIGEQVDVDLDAPACEIRRPGAVAGRR